MTISKIISDSQVYCEINMKYEIIKTINESALIINFFWVRLHLGFYFFRALWAEKDKSSERQENEEGWLAAK